MLKGHRAWVHLALALALTLAGRAWAAEEITINVHVKARANTEEMLKKVGEAFTAKDPTVKVKILPLGRTGYETRVVTQLMARSPELDIVNLTNIELGQVAEAKAVESLDRFLADPGLNPSGLTKADFTPAALKSVSYKGEIYAVPYKFDAIFFFYRTDLIKEAPRTLDEYIELAKKFSRSQNPSSPTEFGTTLQAKRGSVPPKLWAQELWAYGGAFLDDKGKVAVNSQAGVKALTQWVDMLHGWKVVPPDSFSYEFPEVNTAFQQGKVAMSVQWSPADAIFRNKAKSPLVADKVGVAMVPGVKQSDGSIRNIPYLQTWNFTISRFSKHRQEAYRFLSFMMGHPAYLEYAAKEEIPTTRAGLALRAFKQNPIYAVTMESLEKGRAFPTHAKMVAIRNAVDLAIGKALARELTPKAALDEAAREIDREMQ
jgi:multiple sugar transport system substrate-binding protein